VVLGLVALIGPFLVLMVLSMLLAAPVSAHTDLLTGSPGPQQEVGGTVDFIDLVFAEPVTEVTVTVTAPDGTRLDGEMVVADGQVIRYRMEPLSQPGRHVVRYQMISADGDDTRTGYLFSYEPSALPPTRLGDDVPRDNVALIRTVAAVALAVSLMGLIALLVVRLQRNRAALAQALGGGPGPADGPRSDAADPSVPAASTAGADEGGDPGKGKST
jgi:methionine-rich copper-binding protein CopC